MQDSRELQGRIVIHQPIAEGFLESLLPVQVNITNVPAYDDPYVKELGTRMMAGEGPDLIFVDEGLLFTNDLYKMQKAGAFEDLTQVLAADIDLEEGRI